MTPQEQDDEDALALARAQAKAKRERAAASGVTVDGVPAKSDATVETPQGPQRMVNGRPVLSSEEISQRLDGGLSRGKEEAWKATLAGIQGPANFLTDRLAGAKAAISAVPKWFKGDLGNSLGEEYARGRDGARAVVDDAVRAYPTAPLVGSLVTAPLNPVGASGAARVLSSGYQGGLGSFGASRGDNQLGDTLKGAGLGVGVGGTMEAAGKGARFLAGRAGQQGDLAEGVIREKARETAESGAARVRQLASAESAENGRKFLLAQEVLNSPSASAEAKAAAQAVIDDPAVQAWAANRQANAVAGLPGGARRFEELSEDAARATAAVPEVAAADAAGKIANAGQPLMDSTKRLAIRAGVAGAGSLLGRGAGALSDAAGLTEEGKTKGSYLGALAGFAPTGTVNMLKTHWNNPQTQLLANRGAQGLLSGGADLASRAGLMATQIGAQSMAQTGRFPDLPTPMGLSDPSPMPQFAAPMSALENPRGGPMSRPPPQTQQAQTNSPNTSEPEDEGVNALLFYGI